MKDSKGGYDDTNEELLSDYLKTFPRWRNCLLAANPDLKIKGIGSKLLKEFERREQGKKYFCSRIAAVRINFMNDAVSNGKEKISS